ncbi:hypothetical protein BH23BAC1_BH23BAC1_12330 [soil metagenome]
MDAGLLVPILVPIAFFATIFGIVYIIISARNKERIALIEKGADASIFKTGSTGKMDALKFGILFIGISLGLLAGHILVRVVDQIEPPVAYFSMVFLFGGLGLITYYSIVKRMKLPED